jgi:hypothetical protein
MGARMDRDKELHEMNRQAALDAHARDWEAQGKIFASALEYGGAALKAATLISGGSVVVGLAFAGSIFIAEPETARRLLIAVFIFAMGAIAGGVASGFSYLAQYNYADASRHKIHDWEHPFVTTTPEFQRLQKRGDFWRRLAVALVVMSFLAVGGGVIASWLALSPSTSDATPPI